MRRICVSRYANIAMAHNVYQVAMEEGVKRVVVASSNHAADFYEPLIHSGRESHEPKPPSLGGWLRLCRR